MAATTIVTGPPVPHRTDWEQDKKVSFCTSCVAGSLYWNGGLELLYENTFWCKDLKWLSIFFFENKGGITFQFLALGFGDMKIQWGLFIRRCRQSQSIKRVHPYRSGNPAIKAVKPYNLNATEKTASKYYWSGSGSSASQLCSSEKWAGRSPI